MKLLMCKICYGEVDIVGGEHSVQKKIKCTKCGFSNLEQKKEPEIMFIRKKTNISE